MKTIDYDVLEIEDDEHVFHMWEPFKFEIKEDYKFVITNKFVKLVSNIVYVVVWPILWLINVLLFGFKVYGREKLRNVEGGKVTVSNHVHPMDCTMTGLINFPKRTYYPTLAQNFKIPVIRHIIRILYAIPIPTKIKQKERFLNEIEELLKEEKTIHMYPEGALWPYYEKIRQFKSGAFNIAVSANVPIIPIRYVFVKPKGIYKLYKRKKCINAIVLKPIYPDMNLKIPERIEDLENRTIKAMNSIESESTYKC